MKRVQPPGVAVHIYMMRPYVMTAYVGTVRLEARKNHIVAAYVKLHVVNDGV